METKNSRPRKGDQTLRTYEPEAYTSLYLGLIGATLLDVASVSNYPDVERERDFEEIRSRTHREGLSFLTKTLPSFARAVDLALATDTQLCITGFKNARDVPRPRFLGALTSCVFDADNWERSDACPTALRSIRQIGYLFYKLQLPLDEQLSAKTLRQFKTVDAALSFDENACSLCERWMIRHAKNLISRVLAGVDPTGEESFSPRHGPGAVATGEKSWEKPVFRRYYAALAVQFPYDKWFYYSSTHLCDELQGFLALEELDAGTAKVVLVPKDSRGPRLISCEPLEYQWIQQGLMRKMVETIESHPLTAGFVNFTDQTVNRTLALQASLDGCQATLDMKEASDRVSLSLVQALFPKPWVDALTACRSTATLLPDGEIVPLKKFAPMGSAVCFPVEALVFWALSVAAVAYDVGMFKVRQRLHQLPDGMFAVEYIKPETYRLGGPPPERSIYVYGDDIICNIKDQDVIRQRLPSFGLLFNENKCCVGRSFRESCGCDAFKGVDVTPLKMSTTWCPRLPGTTYVSWVALHNAFEARGYYHCVDFLAVAIQQERRTPYADSCEAGVVALVDCRKMAIQENRRLGFKMRMSIEHRLEIYSWVVCPRVVNDAEVPGWAEMQRIESYKGPPCKSGNSTALQRLAPVSLIDNPAFLCGIFDSEEIVTAYQYTLPRQVILRRGWGYLNNNRS